MPLGNFGKISVCWAAVLGIGVYAFVISKRSIEKNRYEHMKVRERMRNSNVGEYEVTPRFANR